MSDSTHIVGGAPFSTPKKSGFFDSLLQKDSSSAASAAATTANMSVAQPVNSSDNSTPSKPKKVQPTADEQLLLLMDQLSSLSQTLADSQMSNKELQEQAKRATELYEAQKTEKEFMVTRVEQQEKEMTRLREKVSFAALDATNEQMRALKLELQEAKEENEALKEQNKILYANYEEINTEYQALHTDYELKLTELKTLDEEKQREELEKEKLQQELDRTKQQLEEMKEDMETIRTQFDAERTELTSVRSKLQRLEESQLEQQLATVQNELYEMMTERNRCRKLSESRESEMKKYHTIMQQRQGEYDALKREIQRLKEDLARKSKSLQDALTALSNAANEMGQPKPQVKETILVTPYSSSTQVSHRDLIALQQLANRLSETITEKDANLSVLRKQCTALGKRVIELEAGVMPDFSEDSGVENSALRARRKSLSQNYQPAAATTPTSSSSASSAYSLSLTMPSPTAASASPAPSPSSSAANASASAAAASSAAAEPSSPLSPGTELIRHSQAVATPSSNGTSSSTTASSKQHQPNHRPDYSGVSTKNVASPENNFPKLSHTDGTNSSGNTTAGQRPRSSSRVQ